MDCVWGSDLDSNENVKLFVKLPSWFKIDTLIGPYNLDWAFVTEREEKLYFCARDEGHVGQRRTPQQGEPENCLRPPALRRTRRELRRGYIARGGGNVKEAPKLQALYVDV
jgi:Endonuclease domain